MARTVLIIDDSEVVRAHVERVLSQCGEVDRVLIASDGAEGFKLLLSTPIDLVLCDVVMPAIDGYKFLALKQARLELHEVPVIMLTGEEQVRSKVRGLEAGAQDYLTKPFDDAELVARVRVHLKIKSLQDELREKNVRLEELSRTDGLTGLFNRRYFLDLCDLELERARRYRLPLSYLMVDIDFFKKVNDTHGHLGGDHVLAAVAALLRRELRREDAAGRYGGEEFAVLLPHTERPGALRTAERIRAIVEANPVAVEDFHVPVTVSVGVATGNGELPETFNVLVDAADQALYRAKREGRNRVVDAR